MKKVAIIGAGPTGVYTFSSLLKNRQPLSISIYERSAEAGIGMPYNDNENSKMLLANIASIEIPPLVSTYIDWLENQNEERLSRYGVDKSTLHKRQFLPRILLGQYFRNQFLELVKQANERGCDVSVHESCCVTDLAATPGGVKLWTEEKPVPALFDFAVIATGHVWPSKEKSTQSFFPSPWSGLMEAAIKPRKVGILGTSLSAIDAAMVVAAQHGAFVEAGEERFRFDLNHGSEGLEIILMSRSGFLPEADFYCPIPYEPLSVATEHAIGNEIAAGADGLLDRVFNLVAKEIETADPAWSEYISLDTLNADNFAHAYFADRKKHDAFQWAEHNLQEAERNKRDRRTVPWRYAILRLHETVEKIVPYLDKQDRKRFDIGLRRVFIDNYAALPSQSIRRLLALHKAKLIHILELGPAYDLKVKKNRTVVFSGNNTHVFDIFINARGQKPLRTIDLPFPRLKKQLLSAGVDIPDVGSDYLLRVPDLARGRIAFGALPYLMHSQPFVQGVTASAEIGSSMARAVSRQLLRRQRPPASA